MKLFSFLVLLFFSIPFSAQAQDLSGLYEVENDNGIIVPLEKEECNPPRFEYTDYDMCIEAITTQDELVLIENDDDTLSFSFVAWFFNGHSCNLSGNAIRKNNMWVYTDKEEIGCVLHIEKKDQSIALEDNATCQAFCGMRGSISGLTFPISAKVGDITPAIKECAQKAEDIADCTRSEK